MFRFGAGALGKATVRTGNWAGPRSCYSTYQSFSRPPTVAQRLTTGNGLARLGVSAAMIGATAFGLNAFLNRETRMGSMSSAESAHLNKTFTYVGGGLTMTAFAAKAMHHSGWSYRMMAMSPWTVMIGGLVASIGTMYGTLQTSPERPVLKHVFWAGFNVTQAAILAPVFFFNPAVVSRAALYTVGVMGSLAYIGATAREDRFLYLGGPLLAGVSVVALSSLAPLVLPMTAMRSLAIAESVSLYGGLAVFSAFVLYDTQKAMNSRLDLGDLTDAVKVLAAGRMAEMRGIKPDPVAQSVGLELDAINIFIRLATILQGQQQRRR